MNIKPSPFASKYILLLCVLISFNAHAEECIFNESVYTDFINKYAAEHPQASIETDGKTLSVTQKYAHIKVIGGGCDHLGASIDFTSSQPLDEKLFLQKVLTLSKDFGSWLMYGDALEQAINNKKYKSIDDVYHFDLDVMTVFSASYDNKGNISIGFYIH